VLEHTFTLVNRSAKPIEIVDVKTSCACLVRTGPQIGNTITTLDPSSHFQLPMRLVVGPTFEAVNGRILVRYRNAAHGDDHPLRELLLRVRSDVEPDYRIEPAEIDLGIVDGITDQKIQRIARIVRVAANNLVVHDVSTSSSHLRAEVRSQSASERSPEIVITADFSDFAENQSLDGHVVVKTNAPRMPQMLVLIRGNFVAPVQLDPTAIIIGSDEIGEVRRELRVRSSRPSRILAVHHSEVPRVQVKFDGVRGAKDHVVAVVVPPNIERSLNCDLLIEVELTVGPNERVVRRVPFSVHRFFKGDSHD
jgi:hypothetical protein